MGDRQTLPDQVKDIISASVARYANGNSRMLTNFVQDLFEGSYRSHFLVGLAYIIEQEETLEAYWARGMNFLGAAFTTEGMDKRLNRLGVGKPYDPYLDVFRDKCEFATELFPESVLLQAVQMIKQNFDVITWAFQDTFIALESSETIDAALMPMYFPFGAIRMPRDYFHRSNIPKELRAAKQDNERLYNMGTPLSQDQWSTSMTDELYRQYMEEAQEIMPVQAAYRMWPIMRFALDSHGVSYYMLSFKLRQRDLRSHYGRPTKDSGLEFIAFVNSLNRIADMDSTSMECLQEMVVTADHRQRIMKSASRYLTSMQASYDLCFDTQNLEIVDDLTKIYSDMVTEGLSKMGYGG
jgi:hypothetical protein